MANKQFELEGVGTVYLYKRRGSKNIRLSVNGDGKVRVTQPTWLPYAAGIAFAAQKQSWLAQQSPRQELVDSQRLGKYHTLTIGVRPGISKVQTRLTGTRAVVSFPAGTTQTAINQAAHTVAKRALKAEAVQLLPKRLDELSQKYHLSYSKLEIRHLKSRWGSCSSKQSITLNYYLMQLPWPLIDYVLVHELAHTEHLHHQNPFWELVESLLPNYKVLRKELNTYQPSVLSPKNTRSMA